MAQFDVPAASRADTADAIEKPSFVVSFVEWPAVLAGAVLAAALAFVFLTFGAAIGLSATSPWPGSGLSARVIASIAIFWLLAQQIGSLMIGGYVAGRMRTRWHERGHEAEFRDGLHGALVWAVGILISAFLLFATASATARTGLELAGRGGAPTTGTSSALDTVIDTMLRPTVTAQASTAAAKSSTTAASPATPATRAQTVSVARNFADARATRAEISRLLAGSVTSGDLSADNRAYLTELVAQHTGMSREEAERRVGNAVKGAREATNQARKAGILAGFVTAAGLVLSLGAAWWAAMKGGQHRDNSVPARFVFANRRQLSP
jgi:hypothetical protein